MPTEWNDQQINSGKSNDISEKWVHGLLKPITATWYKWGDTVDNEKQPATEITWEEFQALPKDARGNVQGGGEKVIFEIDPTTLNPKMQYTNIKSAMRGFPDWRRVVLPGINDTVGEGNASLNEFNRRSKSGNWYVEAQIITVPGKNGKSNDVPKFTRMTQEEAVVRQWIAERFPKKQVEVPANIIADAKALFERLAKRNIGKFEGFVRDDNELAPYMPQLLELAPTW